LESFRYKVWSSLEYLLYYEYTRNTIIVIIPEDM